MARCFFACAVWMFLSLASAIGAAEVAGKSAKQTAGLEFFEQKIRPVLVEHCYECHSTEVGKIKGGFVLDSREGMRKGGDSGPAVAPGSIDESLLVAALKYESFEMPPKGRLPEETIADFEKWIAMGAPDPRDVKIEVAESTIDFDEAVNYWAFQPPRKANLPAVQKTDWPQNEIDHFILAQVEEQGLHPVRPADKRELIRRATFDLLGLPPTPAEVEAFVSDESPVAYSKLIDRLLESPHYGERWGRYWLDVARYAEDQAHTFAVKPNTEAWRYRQWVIDALNADLPYDQFVRMQIAGDQLDEKLGYDRYAALGFFGLGAVYYKNSDKAKAMADELDDRIDTLTRGFLGLTVSCARCHDHKFDPIPTADYYSLAGIFNSSRLSNIPMVPKETVAAYDLAQQQVKQSEKQLADHARLLRERYAESQTEQIAQYLVAAWRLRSSAAQPKPPSPKDLAKETGLPESSLKLWAEYLQKNRGKHSAFSAWYELPDPTPETSSDNPPVEVQQVTATIQADIRNVLKERDGEAVEPSSPQKPGKALFTSPVLTSNNPSVTIDVELAGARQLYLVITDAGDGKSCDHANWNIPRIVLADGKEQKLTDLTWKSAETGYGSINVNKSVVGGPLQSGDKTYEYGIGTHAPSVIVYDLPEGAERFKAIAGLNVSGTQQGNGATVEFLVFNAPPPASLLTSSDSEPASKPGQPKLSKEKTELLAAVFGDGGLFRLSDGELAKAVSPEDSQEWKSLQDAVETAKKAAPAMYPVAHGIQDADVKDMHVFLRGNPAREGEVAPRQFLRILSGDKRTPYGEGSGRRELAEDIASEDNPLTARVIVNRVWQQHFTSGIVGTPSNFGHLGEAPSHPELLDWLAVELVESGWSLKALHRKIMLSATYQLSSDDDAQNSEIDGSNRYLWRMNRRRLDVEAWRDSLLAVSGNLEVAAGGENAPLTGNRRTVYAMVSRHELDELLRLFDFPDANVTSEKRTVTTVPQQQLFVLNSDFVIQQAQALSKRLNAAGKTDEDRIRAAFQLLFARAPEQRELEIGLQFLSASGEDANQKLSPWEQYAQALLSLNEFMYID